MGHIGEYDRSKRYTRMFLSSSGNRGSGGGYDPEPGNVAGRGGSIGVEDRFDVSGTERRRDWCENGGTLRTMTTMYTDFEAGRRVEISVEFVARRSIDLDEHRIHRLIVSDRTGESFPVMIAPGRDALFDLKTGETYTIRGLLVCDPREASMQPTAAMGSDSRRSPDDRRGTVDRRRPEGRRRPAGPRGPGGRRGSDDRGAAVDPLIRRGASRLEIDRLFGVVDDRTVVSVGTGQRDRFPTTGSPSNGRVESRHGLDHDANGSTPERDTDRRESVDRPGAGETSHDHDSSGDRTTGEDDDREFARNGTVLSQATTDDTENATTRGPPDDCSTDPSSDRLTGSSSDQATGPPADQATGPPGDQHTESSSDHPTDRRQTDGGHLNGSVASRESTSVSEAGPANDGTLEELYETLCGPPLVPRLHGDAIVALEGIATTHQIGPRFIEPLVAALERPVLDVDACALDCLREIASEHPETVLEHVEDITAHVTVGGDETTEAALGCCLELVRAAPSAFLDLLPTLDVLIRADSTASKLTIVHLLSILGSTHPFAVKPIVPRLIDAADHADGRVRTVAITAVERVTAVDPSASVEYVEKIAESTTSGAERWRASALRVLTEVGRVYPHAILPHLSVALDGLDEDSSAVRVEAATLCAELARAVPDGMDAAVSPLIDRLDDAVPIVRRHACEALGCLAPPEAADALRRRRDDDADERTRDLADWALCRIERADR